MHHLLAFARLFVGESSTMASEACVLGTRAVYISRTGRGINEEQSRRFGLVDCFDDRAEEAALRRVRERAARDDLEADALRRREQLLRTYRDPVAVLLDIVERLDPTGRTGSRPATAERDHGPCGAI